MQGFVAKIRPIFSCKHQNIDDTAPPSIFTIHIGTVSAMKRLDETSNEGVSAGSKTKESTK